MSIKFTTLSRRLNKRFWMPEWCSGGAAGKEKIWNVSTFTHLLLKYSAFQWQELGNGSALVVLTMKLLWNYAKLTQVVVWFQHLMCAGLWCLVEGDTSCKTKLDPPLDGTECGADKVISLYRLRGPFLTLKDVRGCKNDWESMMYMMLGILWCE